MKIANAASASVLPLLRPSFGADVDPRRAARAVGHLRGLRAETPSGQSGSQRRVQEEGPMCFPSGLPSFVKCNEDHFPTMFGWPAGTPNPCCDGLECQDDGACAPLASSSNFLTEIDSGEDALPGHVAVTFTPANATQPVEYEVTNICTGEELDGETFSFPDTAPRRFRTSEPMSAHPFVRVSTTGISSYNITYDGDFDGIATVVAQGDGDVVDEVMGEEIGCYQETVDAITEVFWHEYNTFVEEIAALGFTPAEIVSVAQAKGVNVTAETMTTILDLSYNATAPSPMVFGDCVREHVDSDPSGCAGALDWIRGMSALFLDFGMDQVAVKIAALHAEGEIYMTEYADAAAANVTQVLDGVVDAFLLQLPILEGEVEEAMMTADLGDMMGGSI